jgi:hypothetical protein
MGNVFQIRRLVFASSLGCQNFKGTALPLEVGARPSHVDHGGSVLNCYQFELARLIVLNLKICLNIGFFTPLKFWQPRGDANMRRRIWKTFKTLRLN